MSQHCLAVFKKKKIKRTIFRSRCSGEERLLRVQLLLDPFDQAEYKLFVRVVGWRVLIGGVSVVVVDGELVVEASIERRYERLGDERVEIGADIAGRVHDNARHVDVAVEAYLGAEEREYATALLVVRYADGDLLIEATGASQADVERVGLVGRADDHKWHIRPHGQIVEARQELRDDAMLHVLGGRLAPLRDGLDLVDEENARCTAHRFVEHGADVLLGLAGHARYELGGGDLEQWQVEFASQCVHELRLAAAGRTVATIGQKKYSSSIRK